MQSNKKHIEKDLVDIITIHYNAKGILPLFFESIKSITYPKYKVHLVDNASEDGSADFVEETYPDVKLIRMDKNYFFCKTNNQAIRESNGEFILLINNDIIVEPDFLDHAVARMKSDEKIAAIATKMMLHSNPTIIDSVGSVILDNGEPFNRGIGQPDIGQHAAGQIFGACFGCALLRRELVENEIGLLDERIFGYFDDIDWSYRANLMGYKVFFEPKAKVYHAHSTTARNSDGKKWKPSWKHYLIRRNLVWTAQKVFEPKMAIKITLVRYRNLLKEIIHFKQLSVAKMNLKVIFVNIITLPATLKRRKAIQKRRKVSDTEITKYSIGEMSFFNDQKYRPIYTLDNLEYTFKQVRERDENLNKLYHQIQEANNTKDPKKKEWISRTEQLIIDLKPYIDTNELKNFRNDILIDLTWFMP